jgi:hypothetical protein
MMIYPATLYNAGWLILGGGYFLISGGGIGRYQPDPNTLNVRRIAIGLGSLAVVALIVENAQRDLADDKSSLLEFVGQLPTHWRVLPWLDLLALGALALLTAVSIGRIVAGLRGPFPPRNMTKTGGDWAWLAICGGLWLWGFFLPASLGWGRFCGDPQSWSASFFPVRRHGVGNFDCPATARPRLRNRRGD